MERRTRGTSIFSLLWQAFFTFSVFEYAESLSTDSLYKYILQRVVLAIPTIIGAAAIVFFLSRLIPGDVCEVRLLDMGMNADLEIDRPLSRKISA